MIRVLTAFILVLNISWTAFPQDRAMQNARKDAIPIRSRLTVLGNVNAQAVLIPRVNARRIFGAEIANNYAVIEINVGNKSPDAALIIHGIFIDYSRWGLSGNSAQPSSMVDGVLRETADPFQASTKANQIASVEYRVVRGQLLDAQMWTARNWTMRLLTLAGSLASAFSFSIGEEGIVKGLQAFGSVGVPGLREAWPDSTIEQLNRISDFGYQTNKVIAKEGAEVIVGFFPIERFLTPGFKALFQRSPALFFAPLQMLVDPKLKPDVNKLLKGLNKQLTVDTLAPLLPCYLQVTNTLRFGMDKGRIRGSRIQDQHKGCEQKLGLEAVTGDDKVLFKVSNTTEFDKFMALDFLSQMSLNSVTVVIDGAMTVETMTIPAKIDAVTFDTVESCGDSTKPCFWAGLQTNDGVRRGTIKGSYLTGGTVEIAEANELGITEVKTIAEGSSDQELHFSFKLTKPIESQKTLHFTVVKPQQGDTSEIPKRVVSLPRTVLVGFAIPGGPTIESVTRDGNKLTVTGTNFNNVPPNPLVVKLQPPEGEAVEVTPDSATSTELKLTIPGSPQPSDCWTVIVTVGGFPPAKKSPCDP